MDGVEKRVLELHHDLIIKHVSPVESEVITHLLSNSTITDNEFDDIKARPTRQERCARLLHIVKRKGPEKKPFLNLVKALHDDHLEISETLQKCHKELMDTRSSVGHRLTKNRCIYCCFVEKLIPQHITHGFIKKEILTDQELDHFNNPVRSEKERARELLRTLRSHRKPGRAMNVLKECLEKKYDYLAHRLSSFNSTRDLPTRCTCSALNNSTTDDELPDSQALHYNANSVTLCRFMTKCPQEKQTIKLCKKMWDMLFELREMEDWSKFNQFTEAALNVYSDNYDIQVLIYRTQMIIATLYRNDQEKANNVYAKAISILDKTTMPKWHLTYILPLKAYLHIKLKQYEEAESLLYVAKQTMHSLVLCVATASVHFFMASYYTAFLKRKQPRKIARALVSNAKTAYLTAIDHYENETDFGIQSFQNQVYIFLALFNLRIDLTDSRRPELNKAVNEAEAHEAENYLNFFEIFCWPMATTWSKLIFYLGKAELCCQRNNTERALDHFYCALEMATKGDFKALISFITRRIKELETITAPKLSKHITTASVTELLENVINCSCH